MLDFREIIDKLIDVSSLTDKQTTGDEYEAAREWIHSDLRTPHDVEVACYHEAGHWAVAVIEAEQPGRNCWDDFQQHGIAEAPQRASPFDS